MSRDFSIRRWTLSEFAEERRLREWRSDFWHVVRDATVFSTPPFDRCYFCNRPFRPYERFYVVKVWADGQEGHYGDRRAKCEGCRETYPSVVIPLDRNWIARLK